MSDLDRLREVGQLLRPPAFEELVEIRRGRNLRARVATASTLAIAATVAVGALAATGHNDRVDPSPIDPSPSPSPTPAESFEIPAGQQTIFPDIGPGDVSGFAVLATVTNRQPQHRGAVDLTTTVNVHTDPTYYRTYCRSDDASVWFFYAFTDGGGGYSQCDEGAPGLPSPDLPVDPYIHDVTVTTFRMFITRLSPDEEACYVKSVEDCAQLYGAAQPDPGADAEFGFRMFDLQSVPPAMYLFKDRGNGEPYSFAAVSSINGDAWLLDRAVVAASDAHRLALELPASDQEHLIDVYVGVGSHKERCIEQHADEIPDQESTDHNVYEAAIEKVCGVDLRLTVEGTTVAPDGVDPTVAGHFSELGARLAAGTAHQVVVEVTRGDPRNIEYAVVVRTLTEMP